MEGHSAMSHLSHTILCQKCVCEKTVSPCDISSQRGTTINRLLCLFLLTALLCCSRRDTVNTYSSHQLSSLICWLKTVPMMPHAEQTAREPISERMPRHTQMEWFCVRSFAVDAFTQKLWFRALNLSVWLGWLEGFNKPVTNRSYLSHWSFNLDWRGMSKRETYFPREKLQKCVMNVSCITLTNPSLNCPSDPQSSSMQQQTGMLCDQRLKLLHVA